MIGVPEGSAPTKGAEPLSLMHNKVKQDGEE